MYLSDLSNSSIKILYTNPTSKSQTYLELREKYWAESLIKAEDAGRTLFNGEIYTLKNIITTKNHIIIELSSCEYKDLALKHIEGAEGTIEKFGIDALDQHCVVNGVLITTDNYYGFGITGKKVIFGEGIINLIGGTLNKDEMEIASIEDISSFLKHEIKEETQLLENVSEILPLAIGMFNTKFEFTFKVRLNLSKDGLINHHKSNDEVHDIVFLTKEEILNYKGKQDGSFIQFKKYLDLL